MVRMRRRKLGSLAVGAGTLGVAWLALGPLPASAEGQVPDAAPWPEFKRDGTRSGVSPVNGPYMPRQSWAVDVGGPVVSGPVIGADGMLYVGTEKGDFLAVRPDGTIKWRHGLGSSSAPTQPLIDRAGHIVVGLQDGYIVSLHPDSGNEDWHFDLRTAPYGDGSGAAVTSPPMGSTRYSHILIGTDLGVVYELDEGGSMEGVRRAKSAVRAGPLVTPDGTVIWASADKTVYGGFAAGGDKWHRGVDAEVVATPAADAASITYVPTTIGSVYAFASDGTERWHIRLPSGKPIRSSPAVNKVLVTVGSDDGNAYGLDPATGKVLWSYMTGGAVLSSAAIGANGFVYIGSDDGTLYVLTPDGQPQATFKTGAAIGVSSPAIGSDGTLYIGSRDNRLYALVEGGPTPTPISPAQEPAQAQATPTSKAIAATAVPATAVPATAVPATATPATPPIARSAPAAGALYFYETGHNVRGAFLDYFNQHGGLEQFGYPLTEEFQDTNNDGTGRRYTMQYFQRARMELHPDLSGTPYVVQLGLLGDQVLRQRGWLP